MFGGTPSNLAFSCMNGSTVEVVAGINLPMLIKLASVRDEDSLEDAVSHAQEAGRKYINVASQRPDREMSAMDSTTIVRRAHSEGASHCELPIINRRGLHARASAKFVQTVEQFDSDVAVSRDGETVAAPRSWV